MNIDKKEKVLKGLFLVDLAMLLASLSMTIERVVMTFRSQSDYNLFVTTPISNQNCIVLCTPEYFA